MCRESPYRPTGSDDLPERANMCHLRFCAFFLLIAPLLAAGQIVEVNGGYTHVSGDGGLDGFNFGASAWMSRRVSIGFDYDNTWDNSHLGVFELTQTGTIITKSHLQNFLAGPRFYFPVSLGKEKHIARLLPFAEVELGVSHLSSGLENPTAGTNQSASDNAFTWMVGGGADYRFSPHWASRLKLDFLRTHFSDTGQSRARLVIGVMYSFGRMIPTEAEQAAEAKRKADAEQAANDARQKALQEKAEAQRKSAIEQVEREKLAADEAAEAYRKAKVELAGAEARKQAAMEQVAPEGSSEAKPNPEVEQAAAQARKENMEQTEREKAELRARLLEHFNHVLPTTDTPRGLVVDMSDVLFDLGKSELKPDAREDLAKLSGIVVNYPSLKLSIEGHSDNTGSAESNQALSEQRASAVRDYLIKQGLNGSSLTALGLGEKNPVADNSTAEGRQKNRRIEIIVSGEVIGTSIGNK